MRQLTIFGAAFVQRRGHVGGRHHAKAIGPHRRPQHLRVVQSVLRRAARERQDSNVVVDSAGAHRCIGSFEFFNQLFHLRDLSRGTANPQLLGSRVSIDLRPARRRALRRFACREQLGDRENHQLRIHLPQLNDLDLLGIALELLQRIHDGSMFGRTRQRDQLLCFRVDRQTDVGQSGQQRLHHGQHRRRIGFGDRVSNQLGLIHGRCRLCCRRLLVDFRDQPLQLLQRFPLAGDKEPRAERVDGDADILVGVLVVPQPEDRAGNGEKFFHADMLQRNHDDTLSCRAVRILDRFEDRTDHLQSSGSLGDEQLARFRQSDDRAFGAHERRDFLLSLGNIQLGDLEETFHQLEIAAIVEIRCRHEFHQLRRDRVLEIDHDQQPLLANQRVAVDEQYAVHQVQSLSGRVFAGIPIIERARRRSAHNERQIGLGGKPLQDFRPGLMLKIKLQLCVVSPHFRSRIVSRSRIFRCCSLSRRRRWTRRCRRGNRRRIRDDCGRTRSSRRSTGGRCGCSRRRGGHLRSRRCWSCGGCGNWSRCWSCRCWSCRCWSCRCWSCRLCRNWSRDSRSRRRNGWRRSRRRSGHRRFYRCCGGWRRSFCKRIHPCCRWCSRKSRYHCHGRARCRSGREAGQSFPIGSLLRGQNRR